MGWTCLAWALRHDESMALPGGKHTCRERPGSFLEPVDKYGKFLSALRPRDRLVLAGIWSHSLLDYQSRGDTGDGKLEVVSSVPGHPSRKAALLGGGSRFTVDAMRPTLQPLPAAGVAVWEWTVLPRQTGIQRLSVVATQRTDGPSQPIDLPLLPTTVEVSGASAAKLQPASGQPEPARLTHRYAAFVAAMHRQIHPHWMRA